MGIMDGPGKLKDAPAMMTMTMTMALTITMTIPMTMMMTTTTICLFILVLRCKGDIEYNYEWALITTNGFGMIQSSANWSLVVRTASSAFSPKP